MALVWYLAATANGRSAKENLRFAGRRDANRAKRKTDLSLIHGAACDIRVRWLLQERHRPLVPVDPHTDDRLGRNLALLARIAHFTRACCTGSISNTIEATSHLDDCDILFPEKLIFDLDCCSPRCRHIRQPEFPGHCRLAHRLSVINCLAMRISIEAGELNQFAERSSPARHITRCIRGTPVIMAWARGCWIGCSRRNGPTTRSSTTRCLRNEVRSES
jgi:hypothetical protein